MTTPLDPKQVVSFEELLMSQVVQQEALAGYSLRKGYSAKKSYWRWWEWWIGR
jgi:hypothetical protein